MANLLKTALIGAAIVGTVLLVRHRMSNLHDYVERYYDQPTIIGYDFWSAGDGCALNLKFVANQQKYIVCGEVLNSNVFVKNQT